MNLFEALTPGLKEEIWMELYQESVIRILMRSYNPELIRGWGISELAVAPDGRILVKWFNRVIPLNDEELAKIF